MKLKSLSILLLFLFAFLVVKSQESLRVIHNELPDDEYVQVDKSIMPRQVGYSVRRSDIITSQVNVDANGLDIIGDAGNEPSIAVDPTNPNRIVIGWRQFDTVTSNFRQAGYGYSLDGGLTWTFPGVLNPGVFRSDPVLDFDSQGNFYYNSLRGNFNCDVYQITDGGIVWSEPFPAKGGDKQWMRMDRTGGIGDRNNYSYWNSNFTTCEPGQFTRSTDGSFTFEDCIMIDGDPFWGTLAVDRNGALYVTGAGGGSIIVAKSSNAQDPNEAITWDFVSNVDLDGQLDAAFPLNPQGLVGQAWVDVDISNASFEDIVYVLASVKRDNDPCDVMFAKSTDGGLTFDAPIRINTDGVGGYNWFGTMSVAPNGRIDVVWLDTRDDINNFSSRLYYCFSDDKGETWSNNEILSPSFDSTIGWPQQNKMGDYFDMVSDNNFAHVAWANTLNGGQDVYYTRITPKNVLSIEDMESSLSYFSVVPNPSRENISINFLCSESQYVSVKIYDLMGREVAKVFTGECLGEQNISWTLSNSLQSGIYFVKLDSANLTKAVKLIIP
ncbi:MAG: hypothetical protein CMC14_03335 [Flavobacteriaceae bacterium]|nr:hypothetical protein [Flavobacteriaceae bacterium]|tara:strand:- start:60569 stop:62224 length:1656 start_codon:yes stop_codon:yes gene_type:complete